MAGLSILLPILPLALKTMFGTEKVLKIYSLNEQMTENTIIKYVYYFIINKLRIKANQFIVLKTFKVF